MFILIHRFASCMGAAVVVESCCPWGGGASLFLALFPSLPITTVQPHPIRLLWPHPLYSSLLPASFVAYSPCDVGLLLMLPHYCLNVPCYDFPSVCAAISERTFQFQF
jgi:hypothetical protein